MLQMWDMHRVVDITFYTPKNVPFLVYTSERLPT